MRSAISGRPKRPRRADAPRGDGARRRGDGARGGGDCRGGDGSSTECDDDERVALGASSSTCCCACAPNVNPEEPSLRATRWELRYASSVWMESIVGWILLVQFCGARLRARMYTEGKNNSSIKKLKIVVKVPTT